MLNVSTEIICNIITRAREINIEDDMFVPGDPDAPSKDGSKVVLEENRVDLTYRELKNAINELEPDQQKELVALFFVGRGDYDTDQWADAILEAENLPGNKRAQFLVSKPMLAELLEEGLAKFDLSCDGNQA